MLTREYLESLMKEPVLSEEELSEEEPILSEEEPMLTREHSVWLMKRPVSSGFSLCARHTSEVVESGHPRAVAAHASL
jgi:hypothetical protein